MLTSALLLPLWALCALWANLLTGCDSYEPPCHPVPSSLSLDEALPSETVATSLALGPSTRGALVATWLSWKRTESGRLVPQSAEAAILDAEVSLRQRISLPLFEQLPVEEVPTDNLGFCYAQNGFAFHWTEDLSAAQEGQPVSVRTLLRLQFVGFDGAAEPSFVPLNMDCVDCVVRVNSACVGHLFLVLVSAWSLPSNDPLPVRGLTWDLDTGQSSSGPIGWIAPPLPNAPLPVVHFDGTSTLVITEPHAWPINPDFIQVGGPIPLPVRADRNVHWSDDALEGTVVWTSTDKSLDTTSGRDVLLQRYDGYGRSLMPVRRLGSSMHVAAIARSGDDLGLIFRTGRTDAFAWATVQGQRIGGDVVLGPSPEATSQTASAELLVPYGPDRFLYVVASPGRIRRHEIDCGP